MGYVYREMIALLFDVHGNLPALEAVIADARAAGADRFVLGGDYAALGPFPEACLARIDELGDDRHVMIRGNWERWMGGQTDDMPDRDVLAGALAFVREAVGPGAVARLAALPATADLGPTLVCHASPHSDMETFAPEADDERDHALLGGAPPRVVFGHSHLQFARRAEAGTELINPGSVGLPFDGDRRAAYGVLHGDGELELRRVDYDVDATLRALAAIGTPWTAAMADTLRRARF